MDEVERRVGPMIDMDKLEITHEVYNDFDSSHHIRTFSTDNERRR